MAYRVNPIPAGAETYTEDRVTKKYTDKIKPAEAVYENSGGVSVANYADALAQEYAKRNSDMEARQRALRDQRNAQINAAFENSKRTLETARDNSLTDTYIAYMKGKKNMPQTAAAAGGSGGFSESLASRHQLNYENNRNSVEQKFLEGIREAEANKANALISSEQDYLQDLLGLESNADTYLNDLKSLVKSNTSSETAGNKEVKGYKVGGQTMSKEDYINYLIGFGMTAEEAYEYLQKNNIPY